MASAVPSSFGILLPILKPFLRNRLAQKIIQELKAFGSKFKFVLTANLYGESHSFLRLLDELKLKWIVTIRCNHGVLMLPGQRVRYTRGEAFNWIFSNGTSEVRYLQEIIFGKRHDWRY